MADEVETHVSKPPAKNLYEVLVEHLGKDALKPSQVIDRIVFVSSYADTLENPERLPEFFLGFLNSLQLPTPATGLLLTTPNASVILLEASTQSARTILTALQSSEQAKQFFSTHRILSAIENISDPMDWAGFLLLILAVLVYCRRWLSAHASTSKQFLEPPESFALAREICEKMARLCDRLADLDQPAVASAVSAAGEMVPTNEQLVTAAARDDVMSLDEFVQVFYHPLEYVPESELTWPLPPPLQY